MDAQQQPPINIQTLLTPEKVAEILGISPKTLQIWRTTRRYNLPYTKVGGKVMYPPEAIQDFIKRRTIACSLDEGE